MEKGKENERNEQCRKAGDSQLLVSFELIPGLNDVEEEILR